MTPPPPPATKPDPIDPTILAIIIRGTLDAIPHHPSAPPDEIATIQDAVYTIFSTLGPRDVMQAMLVARMAAAHFHLIDSLRCAALNDLPPALQLRYRASAAAMSRMERSTMNEFYHRQASPPLHPKALPVKMTTAQAKPAAAPPPLARPITTPETPVQAQATPAPQPAPAKHLHAAATSRLPTATAIPADPNIDKVVAKAQALLADLAQPQPDLGERLQAEAAARAARAATALAA